MIEDQDAGTKATTGSIDLQKAGMVREMMQLTRELAASQGRSVEAITVKSMREYIR